MTAVLLVKQTVGSSFKAIEKRYQISYFRYECCSVNSVNRGGLRVPRTSQDPSRTRQKTRLKNVWEKVVFSVQSLKQLNAAEYIGQFR